MGSLPSHLIPEIIEGTIFSILLICLLIYECMTKNKAVTEGTFTHGSGDAKKFYIAGITTISLGLAVNIGVPVIWLGTGGNCGQPFTFPNFAGQTTGWLIIVGKYGTWTAQIFRLKSFFGGKQIALSYPLWFFYFLFFIIFGSCVSYTIFWYTQIWYTSECVPIRLFTDFPWYLRGLAIHDFFFFILVSVCFGIKIWQLTRVVSQQESDVATKKGIRKRLLHSLKAVTLIGLLSNLSGVVFISLVNIYLLYAAELVLADAFINSCLMLLIFEHHINAMQSVYINLYQRICCCKNQAKIDLIIAEMNYQPPTGREQTQTQTQENTQTGIEVAAI